MLLSKWPIKIFIVYFSSSRLQFRLLPHACTSQMTHKWKIYCIRQCGVLLQFDVHFCVCLWRLETLTLEIMHRACEIEWKLLFLHSHSHDCWILRKEKCLLIFCIFMVCSIYWRRWWRGCRLFGVRVDR